jgi:hypothetical protein
MKLQTNYENMSDRDLFIELEHRMSTFGDNLPTYVTGGEKIAFEGFTSIIEPSGVKLKEIWFGDFLDRFVIDEAFTIIEDPIKCLPYELDQALEIIEPTHHLYRELLIKFLQAEFSYIEQGKNYSQEEELAENKCICCDNENFIPGHLEIV